MRQAYSISEKMRVQIRSLFQNNQNLQNGIALLKTVDGAVGNIVEELRNLKELAINAANDTNTDADRKIIQKDFDQKKANINDIATITNFNGKTLLDGTYRRGKAITDLSSAIKAGAAATIATTIYAGDYKIKNDGIYMLVKGYTGTVTMNAKNVYLTQANPGTALNNAYIVGPSGGKANLWIEGLNIHNPASSTGSYDKNIIQFQGSGNYLTAKGNNTLFSDSYGSGGGSVIYSGNELFVLGDGNLNIKGDSGMGNSKITISAAGGAGIGSGEMICAKAGDINIGDNAYISINTYGSAAIGSGMAGASVGNITIGDNATINATAINGGAGIGSGEGGSTAGDITISTSAKVIASSIGAGQNSTAGTVSYVDDLTVSKPKINAPEMPMLDEEILSKLSTYTADSTPLKIQHGTEANQATNFYINDMHTKKSWS